MAELNVVDGKVTQKDMFTFIREELGDNKFVVEFCDKKLAQLEKRANAPRKPHFNPEANTFALGVIDVLRAANEPMTNKDITAMMTERLGIKVSAQKTAAALRRIDKGQVVDGDTADAPVVEATLVVNDEGKVKTFALA